ncbi:FAD-dependent oxidoreductase [Limosilactobacillus sp. RRLNB_1_1]|uniref:FAD-dependent oxidoreductase n=1 Tax=Limosilactobacillus albertensis TaxID=2759752 RepID=A0A7W3Y8F2_9LACO|nr:FAD-dependent oxidoreductase [Limosilactobacillus albertensis]MBB1069417.1 FAD-dependent oxidoreductase [Limosilactobacillus albertensis]MCD7117943.1 FAD-dependent oxidoreductase [Limosilactobacillus albertensis]MCD7127803.1 FAD-dependent oxidoreductase [Limosilactobacillus albertensis]
MRVIIIGCTFAGMTAASQILRSHPDTEVTIYDRSAVVPSISYEINDYDDQDAQMPRLRTELSPDQLTIRGADVKMGYLVMSIDPQQKTVKVMGMLDDTTSEEHYDKLIIANDSTSDAPALKGIDSTNVTLVKDQQDAKAALLLSTVDQQIAIIGNTPLSLGLVDAFRQQGKEIILITNGEPVLHQNFEAEYSKRAEDILKADNIKVITNEHVTELNDNGIGITVVTDGGSYSVSRAVVEAGQKPDTSIYNGVLDMDEKGVITVNEFIQTSAPDVYAIGGSTTVHYNPTEKDIYKPQQAEAVRQAAIVAENVIGKQVQDSGTQLSMSLNLHGTTMAAVGLTFEQAQAAGFDADVVTIEDNYRPEFMPSTTPVLMSLIWDKDSQRILGAQMMSKHDISETMSLISLCIQNKNTIEFLGLYDTMFQPNFDRPFNYVNILGQAAMAKAGSE